MEPNTVDTNRRIVDQAPDDGAPDDINAEPPAKPLRTLTETTSSSEVVFSPMLNGDLLNLIIGFAPCIVVAFPQTCTRYLFLICLNKNGQAEVDNGGGVVDAFVVRDNRLPMFVNFGNRADLIGQHYTLSPDIYNEIGSHQIPLEQIVNNRNEWLRQKEDIVSRIDENSALGDLIKKWSLILENGEAANGEHLPLWMLTVCTLSGKLSLQQLFDLGEDKLKVFLDFMMYSESFFDFMGRLNKFLEEFSDKCVGYGAYSDLIDEVIQIAMRGQKSDVLIIDALFDANISAVYSDSESPAWARIDLLRLLKSASVNFFEQDPCWEWFPVNLISSDENSVSQLKHLLSGLFGSTTFLGALFTGECGINIIGKLFRSDDPYYLRLEVFLEALKLLDRNKFLQKAISIEFLMDMMKSEKEGAIFGMIKQQLSIWHSEKDGVMDQRIRTDAFYHFEGSLVRCDFWKCHPLSRFIITLSDPNIGLPKELNHDGFRTAAFSLVKAGNFTPDDLFNYMKLDESLIIELALAAPRREPEALMGFSGRNSELSPENAKILFVFWKIKQMSTSEHRELELKLVPLLTQAEQA